MIDWLPLEEVAKVDRTTATTEQASSLPYVGLEHVESNSGVFVEGYSPVAGDVKATKFLFTPNHILYGKLRPYLNKRLRPTFIGVCSTEILPILPKEGKTDRYYLFHYLGTKKFVEWASDNVSGANLPRLSPTLLNEALMPHRSLPEQQAIAQRLERADRLRRLRQHALAISDQYLQNVFLEMFGDTKVNLNNWDKMTVEDVAEVQGGLQVTKRRDALPLKAPYLRVANSFRYDLDLSEVKWMGVTEAELTRTMLRPDDILCVEGHGNIDEVGRASFWKGELPLCTHQNHLIRVRANLTDVSPLYLCFFLNSKEGRTYFRQTSNTTSGLNTISTSTVRDCPVLLPPRPTQDKFAAIVQKHERLRRIQVEALRQAEQLYETLLDEAFGGAK